MDKSSLQYGSFYWLEDKTNGEIHIGQYDHWFGKNCFWLMGCEYESSSEEFNVLGEIEIPDYIDKEKVW